MKTRIHPIPGMLILVILFIGCQKETRTDPDITGRLVHYTSCKYFLKSAETIQVADSLSCIEYAFDPSRNVLAIRHINAGFNCCPGYLYCTIQLQDDTILVREHEAAALCRCNCLYDLDMEISGLEPGTYQVKFVEPYLGDQEPLIFGIDLQEHVNGSFCVTRKHYPWGVTSSSH